MEVWFSERDPIRKAFGQQCSPVIVLPNVIFFSSWPSTWNFIVPTRLTLHRNTRSSLIPTFPALHSQHGVLTCISPPSSVTDTFGDHSESGSLRSTYAFRTRLHAPLPNQTREMFSISRGEYEIRPVSLTNTSFSLGHRRAIQRLCCACVFVSSEADAE